MAGMSEACDCLAKPEDCVVHAPPEGGRLGAGRLTGTVIGVSSMPSPPLSVEGHAHRLIDEAVCKERLGKMYIWCALYTTCDGGMSGQCASWTLLESASMWQPLLVRSTATTRDRLAFCPQVDGMDVSAM